MQFDNHVKEPQMAGEQIGLATLSLQSKYKMEIIAAGGSKKDGLDIIMVMFEKKGKRATQEEARAMIIDCIHTYLKGLNLNKQSQGKPFTEKNLELAIAFGDCECHAAVAIERGMIQYTPSICNPIDMTSVEKPRKEAPIEETYEKALELLHIPRPIFNP